MGDSFRHMYLFPKYEDSKVPGKMKQFLQDLYSGKLHREFHYGPDKVEESTEYEMSEEQTEEKIEEQKGSEEGEVKEEEVKHIPRTDDTKESEETPKPARKVTDGPPESQFAHLGPSKNRYTILRDEF